MINTRWFALGMFVVLAAPAAATPTPIPGGANGVSAVSTQLGQTVFNGVLRIKLVELREATDATEPPTSTRRTDKKSC